MQLESFLDAHGSLMRALRCGLLPRPGSGACSYAAGAKERTLDRDDAMACDCRGYR